jgi:hypothetical protein
MTSDASGSDETAYWLSIPGLLESIRRADADIAAGRLFGEDEIRAAFGLLPRTADTGSRRSAR